MIPLPSQYSEIRDIHERLLASETKVVTVVSPKKGEGRSTVAYSLARRAAAIGQKTLLVDFNAADPILADELGVDPIDWCPGEKNRSKAVQSLGNTGLHFLCAPNLSSDLVKNHETPAIRTLIDEWRDAFDFVVIDTSPLNRRNQGNIPAHMLTALSDGGVMVVLAGETSAAEVIDAMAHLTDVNATLLGAIINDRKNPSLLFELCRETKRLDHRLPRLMSWVRNLLMDSSFLRQDI